MSVIEHIERLQNLIKHGMNPKAEMQAFDPDIHEWMPVTGVVYDSEKVRIYTDED